MSIEKDIFQTKFRNEHQKAAINLIYTYHWLNEKIKILFDKESITQQQFNILSILRGAGKPLSTLQIRQRMLDKMSDTSRIVDRLLIKKLVVKKVSTQDKRLVDISITNEGKKLLERLDKNMKGTEKILANLDNNDLNKLNALLDGIRNGK